MADEVFVEGERTRRVRSLAFGILAALAVISTVALLGPATRSAAAGYQLQALHGNDAPVPPGATPIGPAPAATALPLVVTLQPRDPAALAAEVQAVSDPRSPEYHHFLTPAQFASRFGPAPATVGAVTAALQNEGLTVGPPSATGLSLPVSGTVAQAESAFSTPITSYKLSSGKTGYHNDSEPKVPVAVAPQVQGVLGLDTLTPPKPTTTTTIPQAVPGNPHPASPAPAPALAPGQPQPACAGISNAQQTLGGLDAPQLAQAYSFGPLYTRNSYGAGATVALVEMSGAGYSTGDINTFANCYGITLGANQITQKSIGGGGATGSATAESELDIETVLSLAPKANIEVYEGGASNDIYDVFNQIISDDTAKIVSGSWTNGCEAYVGQTMQSSENTLFQAAAVDGQSVFVASGDQGSEGCNVNGQTPASSGTTPIAQAVDPTTGTLYIANQADGTVSVDGEGSAGNGNFTNASTVSVGSGPDAIALDATDKKVFVADGSSNRLTTFSTTSCNQSTTTGCGSTTSITAAVSSPRALAVSGFSLYVANGNGTLTVYNAATNALVTSFALAPASAPTGLAVDAANGTVYIADGPNNRIEYFSSANCNATSTSGCTTPTSVPVGNDPVALAVDTGAGSLYVANAGTGGGISVLNLATHGVSTTISTGSPPVAGIFGSGVVESIGLSPDGKEVLAVLHGLQFPGNVMATINPSTNTITATVNLQTGSDTMGQLASDGALGYVWVTDETAGGDFLQNLALAVTDPAAQPDVTSVGGTSVSALGPAPTESTWNDQLAFAEGASGGGISQTFSMPSYQQSSGVVAGSSGAPCGSTSGACREVPDVSADADPNTGYVVYDSVNGYNWTAMGGTSGAAPLWAAVTAVAASTTGVTNGFGTLNPVLYSLAQHSPGTYFNDVTAGNNDYNGTNGAQFPAMPGYDMATGLGTPVASQLASGLATVFVAVSGSQAYGGSPTFSATATLPSGLSLSTAGLTCRTVGTATPIAPTLAAGTYTMAASSCSGAALSGTNASDYTIAYTSAADDFTVAPAPVSVAVSGSQTYGGAPTFRGTATAPPGMSLNAAALTCTNVGTATPIAPTLAAGTYTLAASSCSGATLSGTNASNYAPSYTSATSDFNVSPVALVVVASGGSMNYGGTVPTVGANYLGFKNNDSASSLTTQPTCSTIATSSSPVSGSPYATSCGGAVDPNYTISYAGGAITINPAPLTITASSPSMSYGGPVPAITASYSGFENNDSASSLSAQPSCSTTATSSSPVSPPTYPSSCSGAVDSNYAISYVNGSVTVTGTPVTVAVSGSQTYGGSPTFSGTATPPAGISVHTNGLTCATVGTSTALAPTLAAGPYTLSASSCSGATLSGTNASNYTIVYTGASNDFTVNPAPLTITASSGSMTYGGTVPAITAGYSGFVNSETPSSLSTQPTCSTMVTSSSPVSGSPYVSSCGGAVDPNYTITYFGGSITVTTATATVAVTGSQTYGGAPTFSATATLPSGVSLNTAGLSCTTVGTSTPIAPTLAAGTYTLADSSCSGAALSGADAANYTIAYTSAANDFTVAPAPVSVAVSGSQTYGGSPTFRGTATPPPGISVSTAALTCTTVGSSTPITSMLAAGTVTLAASSCSGATLSGPSASNYVAAYTSASNDFTVNQALLTITASSGAIAYGGTVPAITPLYNGFVNGQAASSLTTQPACSTLASSSSPVSGSPFATSCGGAVDANYAISYVGGTVTINPAPLTITASSGTMTLHGTVPTITAGYSGFQNNDSAGNLSRQPTCSTTATSSSPVSPPTYPSSCSGAVDPNYTISYVNGSVTVTGTPVTVAVSGSQTYGGSPTFSSGTVTPPSGISVNTAGLTCTTVGTSTALAPTLAAGSYTLAASSCSGATLSGTNASNFTIVYTSASNDFTVNPAHLTVTASSPTMTVGGAVPTVTAIYSGFENQDSASSLTTQPTCSTTATTSSTVAGSPYPSSCSGAVDPNYTISYVNGSVSVIATSHGYWLVGSDGGIFTFGSAKFWGSTGNLVLQRPVVGMTPSRDQNGYWLVASDGGVFTFGDLNFYGSIPGIGLHPAGSGLPNSLAAPVVGIVPTADGGGYFMVASDGGVFSFGDARFEGSCPGIGGCSGPAVAVMPDASGNGYWLVTQTGHVYSFGDARNFGQPGPQAAPVTSAVRTPDGNGYYILTANGSVLGYGDATSRGGPSGVGGLNPATAIFTDSDGGGYWVASAQGGVYTYGDAPNDGSMAGVRLNGPVIAGTGF